MMPERATAAFAKMDIDNDGKVTREEFSANFIAQHDSSRKHTTFFTKYDTDKDGMVTKEEMNVRSGRSIQKAGYRHRRQADSGRNEERYRRRQTPERAEATTWTPRQALIICIAYAQKPDGSTTVGLFMLFPSYSLTRPGLNVRNTVHCASTVEEMEQRMAGVEMPAKAGG